MIHSIATAFLGFISGYAFRGLIRREISKFAAAAAAEQSKLVSGAKSDLTKVETKL